MPQDVEFEMPFPYWVNPDLEEARERNLGWARRQGLLGSRAAEERYLFSRVAELSAYVFHGATRDDLDLVFDLNGWFFLFDDQFDVPAGQRPVEATEACQELINLLSHCLDPGSAWSSTRPIVSAFADCWRRMAEGMSPDWRARAVHDWVDYWKGQLNEVADRCQAPGLTGSFGFDNHLRVRRKTIGIRPSLIPAERIGRFEVPPLAWHSSHLEEMRLATIDHVIFVNEIVSLDKDEALGDPNLIHHLMDEQDCSRAHAIEHLRDLANTRIRHYMRLEAQIPHLCDSLALPAAGRRAVNRYTQAMRAWIRGNYDWHRISGRYTSATAKQVAAQQTGQLNTEDLSSPRSSKPPARRQDAVGQRRENPLGR